MTVFPTQALFLWINFEVYCVQLINYVINANLRALIKNYVKLNEEQTSSSAWFSSGKRSFRYCIGQTYHALHTMAKISDLWFFNYGLSAESPVLEGISHSWLFSFWTAQNYARAFFFIFFLRQLGESSTRKCWSRSKIGFIHRVCIPYRKYFKSLGLIASVNLCRRLKNRWSILWPDHANTHWRDPKNGMYHNC